MLRKPPFFPKQKFAVCKNEKAFTLVESLFALAIFSILVFFMAPLMQIVLNNKAIQGEDQPLEWEVFSSQLKREVRSYMKVEVLSGRLFLTKDAETIQYERYGTNVRRRVNSTGNEIVLQNVSDVVFVLLNNAVKVTVKDTWGKQYSIVIYSFISWNSSP
ncbi:prepilin-type N-terminal cleavage/methylation domain-containing protein [Neobacillus cucumis]|uniref:competence type IV pilus minor pilin ComGF n=1 Tax=Neobacillus cucumis TaxID=1740721 RepID=UPI0018DFC2BF|nr:competence type IV pilus minor pilin ComGF [Neobacillus cucumis]MBI0576324.1 prepilin-type N-terminal cleavage/methylation domain-containing protein [Neobacillus cucumis]